MKPTLLATLVAAALAVPSIALATTEDDAGVVILMQRHAIGDTAREHAEAAKRHAEEISREVRNSITTMFAGRAISNKVVKGAPYSAEIVTETHQTLSDGNIIDRKTTGAVYRDSEGRVRQETSKDDKEKAVFIHDPVSGNHTVLTPGSKKAVTMPMPPVPPTPPAPRVGDASGSNSKQVIRIDGTEIRIEDGRVFVDGKEQPGGPVVLNHRRGEIRVENGNVTIDGKAIGPVPPRRSFNVQRQEGEPSGDGSRREEVRVQVIRSSDGREIVIPPIPPVPPLAGSLGTMPPMPPMPGLQTMRFESTAPLGRGVTVPLGQKDFEGVRAEGKSTTWTIPAGQVGNRNPINIVSETWYSPELQVTVYSRYSDPRTGESVYKLAGIRRAEPAADLFTVPDEYSVKKRGARR